MTTVTRAEVRCGVCGEVQELMVLGSTSAFGAPDLDLRPPELARSTQGYWVTTCPGCGFAAEDLGEADEATRAFVRSGSFSSVLAATSELPETMRPFAVAAAVAEAQDGPTRAAELHLWAAWAADDAGDASAAGAARERAVAAMKAAHGRGELVYGDAERDALVLADMLRRTNRFPEARALCTDLLVLTGDETHRAVARLQLTLCTEGDRGCHTMQEALGDLEETGQREPESTGPRLPAKPHR